MNRPLKYKDSVLLVETGVNEWGDIGAVNMVHIKGLFVEGNSESHSGYVDRLGTDAHIYLDVNNEFIKSKGYRLEGMYILANLFGAADNQSWYKIERVKDGQRKLLGNEVNNCHCFLSKCEAIPLPEES